MVTLIVDEILRAARESFDSRPQSLAEADERLVVNLTGAGMDERMVTALMAAMQGMQNAAFEAGFVKGVKWLAMKARGEQ